MGDLVPDKDPWATLRQFTNARIGQGRTGSAITTAEHLAFQLDHARAKDAVLEPLDTAAIVQALGEAMTVRTAAGDRQTYLARPDLGRRLAQGEADRLARLSGDFDVAFVIADGLSSAAVHRHAVAVLTRILALLPGWKIAPITVVEQGRVAVADEIGAALGAAMVVILLGERPGLSSPDSLGIYLTWAPAIGRMDAERNCLSNIRPEGLGYDDAAGRLARLMTEARRRSVSGVALKDETDAPKQIG